VPAIGGGLYWVLRGACRVAAERRRPSIGADSILAGLMGGFPTLGMALVPDPAGNVDAGPGDGDGGHRIELPPDADLELSRVMREVHWQVFGWSAAANTPQWTDEAGAAIRLAMALAVARGAPWVGADHLLEALLTDPANAASRLVRQWRVDLDLLTDVARRTWPVAGGQPPYRALASYLIRLGVIVDPGQERRQRSRAVVRGLTAGFTRLFAQAGPFLAFLEDEAVAETVRLGHDRTTPAHLILAVLVLEEQMLADGLRPTSGYAAACDLVLAPFGLDRETVSATVPPISLRGPIAPPQSRRALRTNSKNPPWTQAAARAAERARGLGRGGDGPVGSAQLLYAALSDPEDSGRLLLREHSVDPAAVQDVLAVRLGMSGGSTP
jgi:hypothetical protein